MGRRVGIALSGALLSVILAASTLFNYQTYFVGFNQSYRLSALNPGEVAAAVRQIIGPYTTLDGVWLVGWPYWHDYRAIGIDAGDITFENAILDYNVLKDSLDKFPELYARRPLVFIVHQQDEQSKEILKQHFPDGVLKHYLGLSEKHNFFLFVVPAPQ